MKIAVYGSAEGSNEKINRKAIELGKILAQKGHILIVGGCTGLPYKVSLSAFESGGTVWGFSPATNLIEHAEKFNFPTDGVSKWHFLSKDFPYPERKLLCCKQRNIFTAGECDCAIIIGGRRGTINEYSNVVDDGKPLGILQNTGGASILIPVIEALINKPGGPIIYHEDPEQLVIKLEELIKSQTSQ
jgi:predicted Rossmann-fold nucleotide-binding protein